MKKAIGIIVLGLLWCNVGFASDWLIKPASDGSIESYNIKNAKEFGPLQFRVFVVTSLTKEKIKYQTTIVKKLFDYCGKKDGTYPTPSEIFMLGKPELEDRGIQVSKNGNYVLYETAYMKFLHVFQYYEKKYRGDIRINCYIDKRGHLIEVLDHNNPPKDLKPRASTMNYYKKVYEKERYEIRYFDCNREMHGAIVDELMVFGRKELEKIFSETVPSEEILWNSWPKGSRGEEKVRLICQKVQE